MCIMNNTELSLLNVVQILQITIPNYTPHKFVSTVSLSLFGYTFYIFFYFGAKPLPDVLLLNRSFTPFHQISDKFERNIIRFMNLETA